MLQSQSKIEFPLSFQDKCLLSQYVEKVDEAARGLVVNEFMESVEIEYFPRDDSFGRYRAVMELMFKIVKVGGSRNPPVEYAILKTTQGHRLKFFKTFNCIKLIFPDRSCFLTNHFSNNGDIISFSKGRFYIQNSPQGLAEELNGLSLSSPKKSRKVVKPKSHRKKWHDKKMDSLANRLNTLSLNNSSSTLSTEASILSTGTNVSTDTSSISSEARSPISEQASFASTVFTIPSINEDTVKEIYCPSATLATANTFIFDD